MSRDTGSGGADEEATVHRLDYQRLLRQPRAAFDEGDAREGLELLELAAVFERRAGDADPDDGPAAA